KVKVAALRMYTCCVEKTDYEEFFNRCQMPDTLNSWFLVAQLHVWMCLVRMKQEGRTGKYMCRYIVHCMWEDVEQRGKVMGGIKDQYSTPIEYQALLSSTHVLWPRLKQCAAAVGSPSSPVATFCSVSGCSLPPLSGGSSCRYQMVF
ncbi:PREDICTED: ubiquinol-cytochrome-c reductase complex assembly factor 1-like, partial [Tauraco erythrolophus]|uniref:ubiquinol-cytochrome-c reductase complex assembly factor 1-like n=1 Tax=Tauraco erythrolophus TaxID=121530 RepID=UPI000523BEAB